MDDGDVVASGGGTDAGNDSAPTVPTTAAVMMTTRYGGGDSVHGVSLHTEELATRTFKLTPCSGLCHPSPESSFIATAVCRSALYIAH